MNKKEIFLIKAAADAKHLQAKLNEAEADALDGIAKSQKNINDLQLEVKMSIEKRAVLKKKLAELKAADDKSWKKTSAEFVESIESLEDKNIFQTKTEEWFKSIQNVVTGLKEDVEV